jgi:hypothetical protein
MAALCNGDAGCTELHMSAIKRETQMRKQLATAALLASVGFAPEVQSGAPVHHDFRFAAPSGDRRTFAPLLARPSHFDHMKSAGRLKRHQIAGFSLDDGRLWAEWQAPLHIPQPMRIETEELDAEWMALAPATTADLDADRGWLVARRDLQPQRDGRFWFVRLYASHADPSRIDLLAMSEFADPSRRDAITVMFSQSSTGVSLQSAPTHRLALDLQAPDLRHLIHNYPFETRRHLIPALRRITNLNHAALA